MDERGGRHAWFDEPAEVTGTLVAPPTVPPPALPVILRLHAKIYK